MDIGNRACKGREARGGGQDNHQQERGRAVVAQYIRLIGSPSWLTSRFSTGRFGPPLRSVPNYSLQRPQAGHKALHKCTSWYAYAAMFG